MKVYFDSLTKKVYTSFSFAEGVISLTALIGIVVITVLAIVSIRPRAVETTDDVAVSDGSLGMVTLKNILETNNLESLFTNENNKITYTINTKTLKEGNNTFDLLEISNSAESYGLMNFNIIIRGYAQDLINVELLYNEENFSIFDEGTSELVEIGVPPLSKANVTLQINAEENVNFPLEIELVGNIVTN